MKRLSLFAAVLFAAVMSFAQAPAITFSAVSATGTLKDSTFATTNLTVQTVDPDSKMQIDANTAVFKGNGIAEISCTHRLKTGGKTNEAVTKNYMKLMASEAGTLLIGVRTGSNGDATRKLVVSQNGAEIFNDFITEALRDSVVNDGGKAYFYHMVEVPVAAGQIILSYPVNGLNFYCFALLVAGETKTVITAEKLWTRPIAQMTAVADARQGSGYNGTVYVADKASHSVLAYSKVGDAVTQDTVITNPAICNVAIAVDDAGNIVLAAAETTDAWYATPTHLFVVNKEAKTLEDFSITGLGRTDFISARGNIKSAEGGYVYLYGNSAKALAVHFVNGAMESSATIESSATAGTGGQVVYAGTPTSYIAQVRASALQFVGRDAVTLPGIYNSKLGLDVFTIAGKEVYAYNIGSAYNSLFKLYNATDDTFIPDMEGQTELFGIDATKSQGTSCANWLRATVIDENNVYVHQYCGSDGAALWKVSAVVAAEVALSCDEAQGTVTGGGDKALGSNVTVVATPNPGYEFVAWKKGEQVVSTDASYTFVANGNIALTATFEAKENVTITLAVNDANRGSINLPQGIVMGENSVVYGTPIELTAVPANGATFAGWYKDGAIYSTDYTINLNGKESISLTANFINILTMAYELNGGVTNDSNWVSKGNVMLEIQNDYNARYNGSLAVVKYENGVYYFKIGDNWMPEAEAQGQSALVAGFFQNKTWSADQKCANLFLNNPKYQFLVDIIDNFRGTGKQPDRGMDSIKNMAITTADAYFRADVSGFMLNSPAEAGYPYTCNWSLCGMPEAYQPVWKHAFANPTRIIAEVALNAPYKEGFTFDGWYAAADFSGEKITKISPESNIPGGKLYAKWVEYVQTIAEVKAAAQGAAVKTRGTVNYVNGKNLYIQDASGAILIYLKNADSSVKVGDVVTISGENTLYGGAPEIKSAEIKGKEAGTIMPELTTTISALVKDTLLANFGKRVYVEGVTIAKYDNQSVFVTDGTDTICCYKVKPAEASFPVGMKVNMHMIAGYFNGFQFVGFAEDIEAAPLSAKDPYVYPARGENSEYTLTNRWLICDKLDNYSANRPAATNFCRGMAAKDGKMYFINRENGSFTVVDGATGEMLDPLPITGDHLFEAQNAETGEWKSCVTLAYNDVKFDNAGHCLITGCASGGQRAMVYVVDLATGAATELINERLLDNPENYDDTIPHSWRMDAIGVYGDVTDHAIVMFGNSMNKDLNAAYKWEINNGVVTGLAERIDLVVDDTDETYLINADGETVGENQSACQVFPVDEDYFYWDHHSCRPSLFTMDGTFAYDLKSCPTKTTVWNTETDSCMVGAGHNGICEFQVGDDYFVVMAATNNVETPASSFALFKFADASKDFSGMTPLWYFPAGGMGTQTNAYRTAVPTVEVKDDVATIYLYAGENGYGVYELKGVASGINNVEADVTVQKVMRNGQLYIIKNGVEYSVLGVQVK